MTNLELAQQAYANFAAGNIPAVLESYDDNISWRECAGMPMGNGGNPIHGKDAVLQQIFMPIPQHFENFGIKVDELIDFGNHVLMVGHYHGKSLATGKAINAATMHFITIHNGKVTRFVQVADTAML